MRRVLARDVALAAGVAASAASGAARADRSPAAEEVVELRYTAPPECPTRDAAIAQIRERTPAVRFAARARRVFEVKVAAGAHGYTGALVVDATADKQLTARRCDDLVTALALVIALAIDPEAATAAERPEATGAPEPRAPRETAATEQAPRETAAADRPRITEPGEPGDRPAGPRPRRLDGVIAGVLGAGVTPDLLLAGGLAARAAWRTRAVELAIVAGRDTTRTEAADEEAIASFTRVVLRPAACLLRVRRGLELGGCGHAEVGVVRATGDDIINSRGLTRLWAAAGVHGTLRWPAASRGFAQLQLGATVPFTRDRYRFMPGIIVHATPPVTGWLGLGVGLRFP